MEETIAQNKTRNLYVVLVLRLLFKTGKNGKARILLRKGHPSPVFTKRTII